MEGEKIPDFWEGKDPCWKVSDRSKYVYQKCPAHLCPERPCWESAYTQNEILLGIKRDCNSCKLFGLYNKPNRISAQ